MATGGSPKSVQTPTWPQPGDHFISLVLILLFLTLAVSVFKSWCAQENALARQRFLQSQLYFATQGGVEWALCRSLKGENIPAHAALAGVDLFFVQQESNLSVRAAKAGQHYEYQVSGVY